jgi:hypothetical protein
MKKKRLNLTLSPDVWEALRTVMFERDKPANFIVEEALTRAFRAATFKALRPKNGLTTRGLT